MQKAIREVLNGNCVVYPTSTLPALGCILTSKALDNLYELKKRSHDMIVSIAVSDLEQASDLVYLTDDLEDVGRHLKSVEKSFLGAQNKLYEGQGNLFNQMKDLEKLGAKNKKNLKQPKKNILEE